MSAESGQPQPLDRLVELRTDKTAGRKDPRRRYVGLEHLAQGSPVLLGSLPSSHSVSVNAVFEAGDILFGKLRPNLRKSVLATFAGYCSTDILVLRAKDGVDPNFAAQVFQWEPVFAAAVATAAGTKMPRTSWNDLRRYRAVAPFPFCEQLRIASILDVVNAAIARSNEIIAKCISVRSGLVQSLLTRGLDDKGQLRDPERHPEGFTDSALGRVPREWDVAPLRAFLESTDYGISTALDAEGSLPVLRMNNLAEGEADLSDVKYATCVVPKELLLQSGDVLFNRTNSYEHVGRTGIWRSQLPLATFASYLVRLNPIGARLSKEFLNVLLNAPDSQRRMRRFATPAVQQVNINPTSLQQLVVAIPRSLREQERIVQRAKEAAEQINAERRCLNKLAELRLGLTADLLSGSVRVPVVASTVMEPA